MEGVTVFGSPFNGDPMRLPLISPADLTPEQRPLYDDMRRGIETNFKGFKAIAANGELIGAVSVTLNGFDVPIPDDVRS
jgi:hypothetical protein